MAEPSEKTQIVFPRPLGESDLDDLLFHVAKTVPVEVHYEVSRKKSITNLADNRGCRFEDGELESKGSISAVKTPFRMTAFSTVHSDEEDYRGVSAIDMSPVRFVNERTYSPDTLKLLEDVKRAVEQYFSQNGGSG
jgi:hypothetical protein